MLPNGLRVSGAVDVNRRQLHCPCLLSLLAAIGTTRRGRSHRGVNFPLHLHPLFNDVDVYGDGKPTRIAFTERDVRQSAGSLPVAESVVERTIGVPYFKHDRPDVIERYAAAYRKVAMQARRLM